MPPTGFRIPARLAISHGNRLCHPRGGAQGCRIHLPTLWKSPHPCAQHILLLFQHCVLLPGLRRGVALHTQRRRAGITPRASPEPQSACLRKRGQALFMLSKTGDFQGAAAPCLHSGSGGSNAGTDGTPQGGAPCSVCRRKILYCILLWRQLTFAILTGIIHCSIIIYYILFCTFVH